MVAALFMLLSTCVLVAVLAVSSQAWTQQGAVRS